MAYSNELLRDIYDKTSGYCACCGKKLAYTNYGYSNGPHAKGRWEVAHRRSRATGGSDGYTNLWPMCVSCNRGMGAAHADAYCRR